MKPPSRRALGVVRVSRVGAREGDAFVSPVEQRQRIEDACRADGLELVETIEELDVSGGTALAQRAGLRRAVEAVEAGTAQVIVVAYFDRLVRSVAVQAEVVERVERSGGAILAVDVGEIRADTASRWLSSSLLGMVAEYHRRTTAERTQDAKRRAVARGVAPFPNLPPGYRRGDDGHIEPSEQAGAVAEAFRLRAEGATVMDVRAHLRSNGIERSFHGVSSLLASRVVIGELHFGAIVNLDSHPAIVERSTFERVQRMRSPRGRRPASERLLARLGVLRCGTCGARLVVGSTRQNGKMYAFYRCIPTSDCPRRVTIGAEIAEGIVVEAVKRLCAGIEGTASVAGGLEAAEGQLEAAENELDAAVRAFTGLEDVEAARERLTALREQRDAARDRLAVLRAAEVPMLAVSAFTDWERLTLDERQALIRAVIERVEVAPGRGTERLTVHALGQ
jgi:site-specific DNA recombinase